MIPKYKDIMDLVKKGATIEAQEKIIELREAALELQEENHDLKQRIKDLEIEIEKKESVSWEKPSYWTVNGEEKDGPFCQRCFDVDKDLVRLQGGKNDVWSCHSCKSTFYGPAYSRPKAKVPKRRGYY